MYAHKLGFLLFLVAVALLGFSVASLALCCLVEEPLLQLLQELWCSEARTGLGVLLVGGMVAAVLGLQQAWDEIN